MDAAGIKSIFDIKNLQQVLFPYQTLDKIVETGRSLSNPA